MPIKAKIETLDDVDEALRGLYQQTKDGFVLAIEGIDGHPEISGLKNALTGEKEARRKFSTELAALKEKLGDLDPETAREAMAKARELEDKKLLDEGKVEELLKQRTERMAKDHEARVKALEAKLQEAGQTTEQLTGQLQKVLVEGAIRDAASKNGVRPTAITDVLMRGNTLFRLDGEAPVPRDAKGEIIRGKNGVDPMSIEEWFGGLQAEAPHLFEVSNGAGAAGSGRQAGSGAKRTLSINDPRAIGLNLEAVAAGEVAFTD